jgi:hypothetical protein
MRNDECRMRNENAKIKPALVILIVVVGLLGWKIVFGGYNSALLSFGSMGPVWLAVFLLICVATASIPPIAGPIYRVFNRYRYPSIFFRTIVGIAIAAFAGGYLLFIALSEHRQLFPYIHDEFSYLIQAHQIASGHLWMPAHPLAPFFDSFQLLVTPVYASAYFPGTAMLYVLGIWLHVPAFVMALIISGVVAGLLFWITAELLDAVAGLLAVLLLLADGVYRQSSVLVMGQMPLLLFALLAVVAWLRWRASGRSRWALLTGFFLALAAITRPVDALCYAIPIGTAMLLRQPKCALFLVTGALPLLGLQLIVDHGVTGHWLQTPFGLYADRDYPGTAYGFHLFDPTARPTSPLPQKQALYREYLPLLRQHRPGNILSDLLIPHGPFDGARLRLVLSQYSPVPFPMLMPLLLVALIGLDRRRGVVLLSLPLLVLLYIPYVFFFPHYALSAAPGVIVGILIGARVLRETSNKTGRFFDVALTLLIAGSAVAALPQWSPADEDVFKADLLKNVDQKLGQLPHLPAVVLFTYDPRRNTHEEPVFNADVAWPDDAPIIRAHDLGPANQAIFNYYAAREPSRYFYRFDESTQRLECLGKAGELARR